MGVCEVAISYLLYAGRYYRGVFKKDYLFINSVHVKDVVVGYISAPSIYTSKEWIVYVGIGMDKIFIYFAPVKL